MRATHLEDFSMPAAGGTARILAASGRRDDFEYLCRIRGW
jgi:hypothetical protein